MDDPGRSDWRRVTLVVVALALVLAACAAGPNAAAGSVADSGRVAGFWLGLWHGIITPVTFVISLFSDNVNIYEIHNNGNWYNLGFVIGAVCLIGGSHGARKAKR